MPELPDVTVYVEALGRHVVGKPLDKVRVRHFFFVRTVDPPPSAAEDRVVREVRRLGKRIVIGLDDDLFLVIHLMITGRLRWRKRGAGIPGKVGLAAFDFPDGTLLVTEQGSKKRASLHVVRGGAALAEHDRGGLEPLECEAPGFRAALLAGNHTLKRALTDPRYLSGIGNAYSDEILHRARLSPFKLTGRLSDAECRRLFTATREVLTEWLERFRAEVGDGFPEKVTAFRPEMAVHGKYREPCPVCEAPVQRVVYAENEMNYCARCQTGGKVLADRSLSRLLKDDWPKSIDELEGTA
jgi:formamidopyrimidine-DNA glycosylase